jgi:iron complex transport system ATP-binding protein
MTDTPHILAASAVEFAYRPDRLVLGGVNLAARAGTLTCLLGPNGSGKSTLLRCLMGQLTPTAGSVLLDGKPVRKYGPRALARMLAYVPQFPHSAFAFSVQEIILMGRLAHMGTLGLPCAKDVAIAKAAMHMTQTEEFAERCLDQLSGGEAQRVMIARALAQQPQVLLLDEPTSHLDMKSQVAIYRMLHRVAHDWPMAVICVSHDVNMASQFADELVLMRGGQIVAAGAAAEVIQKDILKRTYDLDVDLIPAGTSVPLVMPRWTE